MMLADLHVHSTYSRHPAEWFLQRIGAQESYTPVEAVYQVARQKGMSYVTLTDHNTIEGALELVAAHPDDCFVSVEITTYFPENGCKVHVLAYDINEDQFARIQELRPDIYRLREYLRSQQIACSVAHATYSINDRLSMDILEKLILLFDVFESINGARSRLYNQGWTRILQRLTADVIRRLEHKHRIEPWSEDPWIKGFTGGSDDHSGLLVADAFTMGDGASKSEFLGNLSRRETLAGGQSGDHKSLAFAIYKIAYDFSQCRRTGDSPEGFWRVLHSALFADGRMSVKEWFAMQRLRRGKDSRSRMLGEFFDAIKDVRQDDARNTRTMIDSVYDGLSRLSDQYFTTIADSLEHDVHAGEVGKLLHNLLAALPAIFLGAPFVSSMRHLHRDRLLVQGMEERLNGNRVPRERKLLWFSDTVTDLNGVAVTMRELAMTAHRRKRSFRLVACLESADAVAQLPPNLLNLPCIYSFTPEFYSAYTLRVPSLLKALDLIAAEMPDEIVVSTPGPVGLIGLLVARLLGVKCTAIYHTDFTRQAEQFIGDESITALIETAVQGFFRLFDEIRVPTREYMRLLVNRGLDASHMKLFRRGMDHRFAMFNRRRLRELQRIHTLPAGLTLMWAGRLGKEKNLGFLMDVYEQVRLRQPAVNLLVVGDGPELEALRARAGGDPRVCFTGRVDRTDLPCLYAMSDLFVFPSTTDTFGMVVLEAQTVGLTALVSNVGGPQEIVRDGETGHVLPVTDPGPWVETILRYVEMHAHMPERFVELRRKTRRIFRTDYDWNRVLDDMMGPEPVRHSVPEGMASPSEPKMLALV